MPIPEHPHPIELPHEKTSAKKEEGKLNLHSKNASDQTESPLSKRLRLSPEKRKHLQDIYESLHLEPDSLMEKQLINAREGKYFSSSFLNHDGMDVDRANEAMNRISTEIMGQQDWNLPQLPLDAQEQDLKGATNMECIIHPLYGVLRGSQWNEKLWMESGGNLETYLEKQLLSAAQGAVDTLLSDKNAIPESYLFAMEIVQELDAMSKPPDASTMRIFVMPRRVMLTPNQQGAMQQVLQGQKKWNNVRVIDSISDKDGQLTPATREMFAHILPYESSMRIQGGYLGGCLDGFAHSLDAIQRKDVRYSVDFDASTGFARPFHEDVRSPLKMATPLLPPTKPLRSMQDVIDWVHQNTAFNAAYKQARLPDAQRELREMHKTIKITKMTERKDGIVA